MHDILSCAVPLSDAHCRLAKVDTEQEHENTTQHPYSLDFLMPKRRESYEHETNFPKGLSVSYSMQILGEVRLSRTFIGMTKTNVLTNKCFIWNKAIAYLVEQSDQSCL